jgi:PAS domain S-box-containing protein
MGTDRKQFDMFFDKMLDGFAYHRIVLDKTGKPIDYVFLEVNNAFERLTGLKRRQIIGKRATEALPGIEKDPTDWIGVYGRVALTEEPVHFENYAEPLGKWFKVSAYCPEKGHFVTLFEDITERKKAEEALRESEQRLKFHYENSPLAVIEWDNRFVVTHWTGEAQKMFGWNTSETVGKLIMDLHMIYEADIPTVEKTMSKLSGGVSKQVVSSNRNVTKNGEIINCTWYNSVLLDEKGKMISVLSLVEDNSARLKAEKELEETNRNLENIIEERTKKLAASAEYARSLIEASLDPLVTISAKGKITDVNKATERITGCSRAELIGSDFSNYFTEPDKARKGYKQVFDEGFVTDYPLAIKNESGKETEVLYNASLYKSAEGEIQGVFAAARDVTEHKKLEKQLQEKDRLAAIGETAGMVGHDLRNPLQTIVGEVYLANSELAALPESEQKEALQENIRTIEEQIIYMNKIVSDLQDFVKSINPEKAPVDLEKLIIATLSNVNVPQNIEVETKLEKLPIIRADPNLLKRVFMNLLTNAVQAMPEGGELTVQTHAKKGKIHLTIKDTGVGIPESVKPKLFKPLFTTKSKGQGFGLAVCKRVIEAHGGKITLKSQEGEGAEFTIELPYA